MNHPKSPDVESLSSPVQSTPVQLLPLSLLSSSRNLSLTVCGLLCVVLLAGCPQAPAVEVVIKAVEGAGQNEGNSGAATVVAGYGTLTGTVTFDGAAPSRPPLVAIGDTNVKVEDRTVCAATPVPDESLLVNSQNNGVANVVIFLEKRPTQIKPELEQPPSEPVFFDQKACQFMPHVLTVRVGQPLLVISGDPIPHNTHTYPKRNDTFNKLIGAGERTGIPCNYKKPESAPLTVSCDYHTWMKAYHFPVDHPYVAITDASGKFKIEGLPAGKHSFNVWHERSNASGQLLERKLQITIEVDKVTNQEMKYGAKHFAGAASSAGRFVAYDRLLEGGNIAVAERQGN